MDDGREGVVGAREWVDLFRLSADAPSGRYRSAYDSCGGGACACAAPDLLRTSPSGAPAPLGSGGAAGSMKSCSSVIDLLRWSPPEW